MSKVQLPQEILAQVFQYVQPRDLLACLSVCHIWYVHAQHHFYKQIEFFELASIDRFIACMQSNPDHPNLLVKKITFTSDEFHKRQDLPAFKQQFKTLVSLCPHVETLATSPRLKDFVIHALYSLPTTLKNLGAFPYAPTPEYTKLSHRYNRTLKEYAMYNFDNDFVKTNFGELRNFPRLQKLYLMDAPVRNLEEVECILSMCRNLQDLSVEICDDDMEEFDYDDFDPFDEFVGQDDDDEEDYAEFVHRQIAQRLNQMEVRPPRPQSLQQQQEQQMQQYPKMEKLLFRSGDVEFDLGQFIPFLHKLTNLKRLELEAVDILTAEKPRQQLNHLKTMLEIIHTLSSSYFIVEGADFNKIHTVAQTYLQLFFQPHFVWLHTTLKIENATVKEFGIDDTLCYKTYPNRHRELAIVLPEFETNDPAIHAAYVKIFAPYVNEIELDYERTVTYDNACESFLYNIVSKCNVLHSLTVHSGNCSEPWSIQVTNTGLQKLVLSNCFLSSEFLESLSSTCVNLDQLTLADNRYSKTDDNKDLIAMPDTELQQLNLNLEQFKTGLFGHSQQTLIKISDSQKDWYFYTDFEKKEYMVPGQRQMKQGRQVVFKFKKIDRLKAFHIDHYNDILQLT
jgi:hypothetical protein